MLSPRFSASRAALLVLGLLLCLSGYGPVAAQDNAALVKGAEEAGQNLGRQLSSGSVSATWTGMGLVSGDMVDLEISNDGDQPQTFRFVPGIVLEDPGQQVQPILLEERLEFTLQPGETVKKRMRGYCLDFSKNPPAADATEDYAVAEDLTEYRAAVAVLYGGLRLQSQDKLKPVLRPLIHRTVVTQRAVWAVQGGDNPNSREELKTDIDKERRNNTALFPEGQLDCLSRRLWNDVQKIMAEAEANE